MNCIKCGEDTRVTTTYQNANGITRRRRICLFCDFRFTTRERADERDIERAVMPEAPQEGKGVDNLSHAWYNPSSTNKPIEDTP
jgi:transcriptional regulator NrdR family protein